MTQSTGDEPASQRRPRYQERDDSRGNINLTKWIERAQDVVSSAVGVSLVLLAAVILFGGIIDFFRNLEHVSLTIAATNFLDSVLLVLILVEIVHTVVISLRAHALAAEPFIVVGLVAVIRKILFALGSQEQISVTELALYLAMATVFVASLVAIRLLETRSRTGSPGEPRIGEI